MPIFKLPGGESWSAGHTFILAGLLWSIGSLSGNVALYVPIAMTHVVIGLWMLKK